MVCGKGCKDTANLSSHLSLDMHTSFCVIFLSHFDLYTFIFNAYMHCFLLESMLGNRTIVAIANTKNKSSENKICALIVYATGVPLTKKPTTKKFKSVYFWHHLAGTRIRATNLSHHSKYSSPNRLTQSIDCFIFFSYG